MKEVQKEIEDEGDAIEIQIKKTVNKKFEENEERMQSMKKD